MNKKISFLLIFIAIIFLMSFVFFLVFVLPKSAPKNSSKAQTILVEGDKKEISDIGVSLPFDKNEAMIVAKKFCNINLQKTFKGDIYGEVREVDAKWYIDLNITNCLCGVAVDEKTGETECYKSFIR